MLYVCSLPRMPSVVSNVRAQRLISLLSAGTPVERPEAIHEDNHLLLSMHDIVQVEPDMVPPGQKHVEELLLFAMGWDRIKPMVVHCFAGVSRSTAAAYIIGCQLAPHRDEAELAQELRLASPSATPNARLVAIADKLLGRDGRMVNAIAAIGRGADAFEGEPFEFRFD
ncbi:protein tyrosine phosphatase [Mesorhizobium sp. Z1-4]|uniref:tyrosine phosphatase family protein n=1 Tax=Mesorhizobium sp. Z1-4 TaxID=2448478 RepID=UPI000FD8C214|nr:protein tyrosine phosphatase [Mesorhizobium sp. Z1-4]